MQWFKSYYVVWKQNSQINEAAKIVGLNRTMQYGNKYLKLSENEE